MYLIRFSELNILWLWSHKKAAHLKGLILPPGSKNGLSSAIVSVSPPENAGWCTMHESKKYGLLVRLSLLKRTNDHFWKSSSIHSSRRMSSAGRYYFCLSWLTLVQVLIIASSTVAGVLFMKISKP